MKTTKTSTKATKVSEASALPLSEKSSKESKPVKRAANLSTAAKTAGPVTTAHKAIAIARRDRKSVVQ